MAQRSVHNKSKVAIALALGLSLLLLASQTCLAARPPRKEEAKRGSSGGVGCMSDNGFPVDFFVIFKYPDGSR
jgi:hypothetical protein